MNRCVKKQMAATHLRDRFVEKHAFTARRWDLLPEPRLHIASPPDAHEAAPCRRHTNAPDRARHMARGPITRTRREATQTATPTQRPDPGKHKTPTSNFVSDNSPEKRNQNKTNRSTKVVLNPPKPQSNKQVAKTIGVKSVSGFEKSCFSEKSSHPGRNQLS